MPPTLLLWNSSQLCTLSGSGGLGGDHRRVPIPPTPSPSPCDHDQFASAAPASCPMLGPLGLGSEHEGQVGEGAGGQSEAAAGPLPPTAPPKPYLVLRSTRAPGCEACGPGTRHWGSHTRAKAATDTCTERGCPNCGGAGAGSGRCAPNYPGLPMALVTPVARYPSNSLSLLHPRDLRDLRDSPFSTQHYPPPPPPSRARFYLFCVILFGA